MTEKARRRRVLPSVFGQEAAGREHVERSIVERFTVLVQRIAAHIPRTRTREGVFVFGRLRPEMIQTQADVLDDEWMIPASDAHMTGAVGSRRAGTAPAQAADMTVAAETMNA